ncbi:MAG: exodeoxyribonuclease III [Rickettsiales bacterium]
MISVATWNVNSVKSRLPHLLEYLRANDAPDVLVLQETKTTDDAFPRVEAEDAGYNLAVYGQKSYNGVAILSRFRLSEVKKATFGGDADQARYIEALVERPGKAPIRAASVYVPNGHAPDSPKFAYKMRFMEELGERMRQLWRDGTPTIVGGDFNAVFLPDRDVYDPVRSEGAICCHPAERRRMRAYEATGWRDLYRAGNPFAKNFTWWDYRAGARQKNMGLRIDFLLASPEIADASRRCDIDDYMRDKDSPSDHAPVRAQLSI